jgi:CheY-like chemotaxis protein
MNWSQDVDMQAKLFFPAEANSKHQPKQILFTNDEPSFSTQVLYIDDEPSIATLVQCSLESFTRWQVTTATGSQAFEIAKTGTWDILLLEIALYSEEGLTLYQQLTTDPSTRQIPLVLLTSKVMPIDFRTYKQMRIAGVIAKPFDPVTLGIQIADLLGWSL